MGVVKAGASRETPQKLYKFSGTKDSDSDP
jgi:hypothetical protein